MRRTVLVPVAAGLTVPAIASALAPPPEAAAWELLSRIQVEERIDGDDYAVVKRFPPEIENGAPVFEISGFLIPVGVGAETTEFMLVPEAGMCPFCGSSEHGTAIEVSLAEPLAVDAIGEDATKRVVLRGALQTVTDPQTFQAFYMTDARVAG